jgi:hypothetical protein
MSEIGQVGEKKAKDGYGAPLLPGPDDRAYTLVESRTWGPFEEGDFISILLNAETYLVSGTSSVTATTDGVLLPIGRFDFVVPTGVTHIALISSWAGAVATVWKS